METHPLRERPFYKTIVSLMLVLLILLWQSLFLITRAAAEIMYVNTPSQKVLVMRDKPGTSGKKVASFAHGAAVNVVSKSGAWYKVRAAGYSGYMYAHYLSAKKPGGSSSSSSGGKIPGKTAVVKTPSNRPLNLRAQPRENSKSLGRYLNGVRVTVHSKAGRWYRVSVQGKTGYMYSSYLSFGGSSSGGSPGSSATGPRVVVNNTSSVVYLRKSPGTDGQILKRIPIGTTVQVLSSNKYWSMVRYLSVTGYVDNRYLK